jgi:hypothetical protein
MPASILDTAQVEERGDFTRWNVAFAPDSEREDAVRQQQARVNVQVEYDRKSEIEATKTQSRHAV